MSWAWNRVSAMKPSMKCKPLAANFVKAALPILVCLTTACAHHQERMPPRTQDRTLDYRIQSQERPERASLQKPDEVVQTLALKNGDVAADVLGYLKERADKEGISNIVTIVSREEDPLLPKNAVDLVFFCDTTHHIVNRVPFYRAMAPGLKQGGRVAIIDYKPDAQHHPHPSEEHVPRSQAISEMEDAGFKYVKDFEFLRDQYFLIFEKP